MKTVISTMVMLALALPFAAAPGRADEKTDVENLVRERIVVVIGLLKQKDLPKPERNKKIVAAVEPFFDFSTMATLSLGKTHWTAMTKEQRAEFSKLFVVRLKESYLEKLDLYTDEDVVVEKAEPVKSRIYVVTNLVSKDDKKEMIYKFYKARDGWKVYDVEILGVSVVQTYRSQFSGFLRDGSYAQLLEKLRTSGGFTIPTGEKTNG